MVTEAGVSKHTPETSELLIDFSGKLDGLGYLTNRQEGEEEQNREELRSSTKKNA